MADQIIRMKGESHIIEIVDAGVGQRGVTSVFVTMIDKSTGVTQSVIKVPMAELIETAHLIIKQYGN
jgi:hypothetical protein